VGAARIDYLDRCYRQLGRPPIEARSRAVFAYAAYRGLLQLAYESPASLPATWSSYTDLTRQVLLPAARTPARKTRRAPDRRRRREARR
jgi:hypothetical protein